MATTTSGTSAYEVFGTTSPVTGSAPTAVDGTDGQLIEDFDSITVMVQAPSGQTLSGAGTLLCYVLDPYVAVWARYPQGDLAVSTASVRTLSFEPFEVLCPRGSYAKWVPSAVTFGGGSTGAKVFQLGFNKTLKGAY